MKPQRSGPDSKVDVVVRGGTVVMAEGTRSASVMIRDGQIDEVCAPGAEPPADLVIDARGKLVLPGIVDPHVHVDTPGPEGKPLGKYSDSFETLSRSAAFGGVTTLMTFVFSSQERPPVQYVQMCRRLAEAESYVDVRFHFGIVRDSDVTAVPDLVGLGLRSFKTMMDYKRQGVMVDDRLLLRAMERIASCGGLMMVHAEDGEIVDHLEEATLARGDRVPPTYARCRPPVAERLAIARAAALAEVAGCPLYVVHLSSREGLEAAKQAKDRGQRIIIETCPHYLLLTRRELEPDRLGPLAKIGPPLREEADNAALWAAVTEGTVDLIGSDHAPRTKAAKLTGLTDIFAAPFGGPGVETLLPVTLDAFRRRGLPLAVLTKLLCEVPARVFGLFPRKGVIAQGADADLVVVDPDRRWTIAPSALHTCADYSLWAGREVAGKPVATLVRGRPVVLNEELVGKPGWGRYVADSNRG